MEQKKEPIFAEEIEKFNVMPYTGEESHAPEHPDITAFMHLMIAKGYTQDELLVNWGECIGIKKELKEQGNEEKFESQRFQNKFEGELTLLRAVCYLFEHLKSADMEMYFDLWCRTLREISLAKKA